MKTHLTTEQIYDLAYDKLDVSNIKVDKEQELAEMMDLEYDEEADAYKNPDYPFELVAKIEEQLNPKYMNDVFTWAQIKKALEEKIKEKSDKQLT